MDSGLVPSARPGMTNGTVCRSSLQIRRTARCAFVLSRLPSRRFSARHCNPEYLLFEIAGLLRFARKDGRDCTSSTNRIYCCKPTEALDGAARFLRSNCGCLSSVTPRLSGRADRRCRQQTVGWAKRSVPTICVRSRRAAVGMRRLAAARFAHIASFNASAHTAAARRNRPSPRPG
jgi:hypothetical protein